MTRTAETAVRERLRDTIMAASVITPAHARSFAVNVLTVERGYRCAEQPTPTVTEQLSGTEACRRSGIKVTPIPRLATLAVVDAPGT